MVGATGNVGSALLRALAAEPAVGEVVGVARRRPEEDAEPYRGVRWVEHDVGALPATAGTRGAATDPLDDALAGADAVVHLAWLIQPNRDRTLLRRTNVDGTARVAAAAARAGVPHLVVASSVGAYSPAHDDRPHDETWPTGGVPTSHYSVDKAAQERVLDRFEARHPEAVVTRVRPSLVFQPDAGAEVDRYFLGPLVPRWAAGARVLPVVPLPSGLRFQAVHADDLAQAYLAAVLQPARARGAFNVAGDGVLTGREVAELLDHGHALGLPPALVRRVLALAWQAHVVPTDPGWLDMAMSAPVMDTARVRDVLGWSPRHTAAESLAALLGGLARREGLDSPPLRPGR